MGKHLAPSEPRKKSLWKTVFLSIAIVIVAAGAAIYGVAATRHENFLTLLAQSVAPDPVQLFGKDRILILLMGKDYDYNTQDYETSKASRSDVIQVYSLDLVNHRINEVSVPRDMDVILPNGTEAKINEALSEGGVPEAESVIGKFLGVPGFDRYVVLRINATKSIIDAIGGVDVPVKEQMDYDDSWGHLHIHFKPGMHHMNGEQAVSYSRFRHDSCGDPCRITRQQQVLRIIANKLKNNKFNDLAHAGTLIGVFQRNVDTNLSNTEMLALAASFFNLDPKTMKTAQVPYVDTKDTLTAGNVLIPDDNVKKKLVTALLLPPPPAPSSKPVIAVLSSSVRVAVMNATGVSGEARKIADSLRSKGFVIATIGNAPAAYSSEIHDYTTQMLAGVKVRSALPVAFANTPIVTEPTAARQNDVTIIVGRDITASSPEASLR
ncbi:MAG: LCP family protein [Candidatus Eremiobacteraeota bacterium]|nr:LCP family protein [Candidatus Eremiobacteraeota bacterium]